MKRRLLLSALALLLPGLASAQSLVAKGSTDVTRYVIITDSTDGSPETGVTITGLDLQYTRNRATPAAKVDATALSATDDAHADNQCIEVDATSSPGLYRCDWPDAAFAAGTDKVLLVISGTGFYPAVEEIQLVDFNPEDPVRLGLTSLPNAVADAAGGLAISDAGGLDLDALAANVALILADTGTDGVVLANSAISDAKIAADSGLKAIRTGAAQAGAAGSITLDTGASSTTDFYAGADVYVVAGTGAGQFRNITAYNGTSKVATVVPNWAVNPAVSSTFVITPTGSTNVAAWRRAQPNTLQVGRVDSRIGAMGINTIAVGVIATDAINAAAVAADAGTEIGTAVWASGTRTVTAATNITSTGGTTVPQTGDSFARIGVAGAGLTAAGGDGSQLTAIDLPNQTMDITGSLSGSVGSVTATVDANLVEVLATAVTETNAGDVAESFSFFYDVDPVTTKTVNDVGVAGSGLTKADVRSALFEDAYDLAATASDGSAFGRVLDADTDASFDWVQSTDSLEAIANGSGLTSQQVRDAMKLAPTGGAPAAGSVDEHLDDILADTAEIGTAGSGLTESGGTGDHLTAIPSTDITKNSALSDFEFLMVQSADHITPATGLTVAGQISCDGAAFTGVAGTIAEVGNGVYQFDALAADTNCDFATWRFNATGADTFFVHFRTRP